MARSFIWRFSLLSHSSIRVCRLFSRRLRITKRRDQQWLAKTWMKLVRETIAEIKAKENGQLRAKGWWRRQRVARGNGPSKQPVWMTDASLRLDGSGGWEFTMQTSTHAIIFHHATTYVPRLLSLFFLNRPHLSSSQTTNPVLYGSIGQYYYQTRFVHLIVFSLSTGD